MTPWVTLREWWQWLYAQFCTFLYFDRITRVGDVQVPSGPVLFVGTHRNGILDALVYSNVLGRMTFVLAKGLHKTFIGRLLFGGIGVIREQDGGDRSANKQAIEECRGYLKAGSRLFVFPEGKSALGPRLLEIKPGAAKITLEALADRPDLKVVPVAVAYERPWGFRSRVEVKLGQPVHLGGLDKLAEEARFATLHSRIEEALHDLTAEFKDEARQEASEVAANARRLAGLSSHADAVKRSAEEGSRELDEAWRKLKANPETQKAARYNRLPLLTNKTMTGSFLKFALLGPFVLAMVLANGPVLLAARYGAKKLANDRNVVSLMRLVVGLPLMLVLGLLSFVLLAAFGLQMVWFWSLALSLIGLGAYDTVLRSLTLLRNIPHRARMIDDFSAFLKAAGVRPELI